MFIHDFLTNVYAADVFIADQSSQNDSLLNSQIGCTERATVLFSKSARRTLSHSYSSLLKVNLCSLTNINNSLIRLQV